MQWDKDTGAGQWERAQGTGPPAPAPVAARDTSFLARPGLTRAAEGTLESHRPKFQFGLLWPAAVWPWACLLPEPPFSIN